MGLTSENVVVMDEEQILEFAIKAEYYWLPDAATEFDNDLKVEAIEYTTFQFDEDSYGLFPRMVSWSYTDTDEYEVAAEELDRMSEYLMLVCDLHEAGIVNDIEKAFRFLYDKEQVKSISDRVVKKGRYTVEVRLEDEIDSYDFWEYFKFGLGVKFDIDKVVKL